MGDKVVTARTWSKADILSLLERYKSFDKDDLKRGKVEYKGLLDQRKILLKPEQYHLVFDDDLEDDPRLELTDNELLFLVGDDWEEKKQLHITQRDSKPKILGQNGFNMRLDEVPPELCLNHFDILAQGKNVKVRDVSSLKTEEIPPTINLSIALSLWGCKKGRGLFPWQSKDHSSKKKLWQYRKVPDLMLVDYEWSQQDKEAFLHGTYEAQRAFLDAEMRLRSIDPVLPFIIDFPGTQQDRTGIADFLRTAVDEREILAGISITGTARIGWISDLVNNMPDGVSTDVASLELMYDRAIAMLDDPAQTSVMFYDVVLDRVEQADEGEIRKVV